MQFSLIVTDNTTNCGLVMQHDKTNTDKQLVSLYFKLIQLMKNSSIFTFFLEEEKAAIKIKRVHILKNA